MWGFDDEVPVDRTGVNGLFNQKYWGKVNYDKTFDMTNAECQRHIYDWCHQLKYSGDYFDLIASDEYGFGSVKCLLLDDDYDYGKGVRTIANETVGWPTTDIYSVLKSNFTNKFGKLNRTVTHECSVRTSC